MNKSKFFIGQPVFAQLLGLIPRKMVLQLAGQHRADRYCKRFSTYDHLVTMLYSIFNNCHSLREATTGLLAWEQRLQHVGIRYSPRRSTLSDANQRRGAAVFEQIYMKLLDRYGRFLSDSRSTERQQSRLYIFDSTTITLFEEVLKGAGMRGLDGRRKGGIKVHTLLKSDQDIATMIRFSPAAQSDSGFLKEVKLPAGSIIVFDRGYNHYQTFKGLTAQGVTWVSRLRQDSVYEVTRDRQLPQGQGQKGILRDQEVIMGHQHQQQAAKVQARIIAYKDPQSAKELQFLTNNRRMAPATIAGLYRQRWQIEVLFKRLKQNYPLKYFLGDSSNAIQIQIWCALIADLLLKIIKRSGAARWSFSNMVSMIRIHLMTYIDLYSFLKSPEKALIKRSKTTDHLIKNPTLFPT